MLYIYLKPLMNAAVKVDSRKWACRLGDFDHLCRIKELSISFAILRNSPLIFFTALGDMRAMLSKLKTK